MKLDLTKYAWVNEKDGITYYRHIDNPKDEIQVENGKRLKVKKKLREILKDDRRKGLGIS